MSNRHHRRQTGKTLDDPEKLKEGEVLGEELTNLDSVQLARTFGLRRYSVPSQAKRPPHFPS